MDAKTAHSRHLFFAVMGFAAAGSASFSALMVAECDVTKHEVFGQVSPCAPHYKLQDVSWRVRIQACCCLRCRELQR